MIQTIALRYNFGVGIAILLIEALKPELAKTLNKTLNIDSAKFGGLISSFINLITYAKSCRYFLILSSSLE